jgi:hypothetical protein
MHGWSKPNTVVLPNSKALRHQPASRLRGGTCRLYFSLEQWAGGSAGQLLKTAKATDGLLAPILTSYACTSCVAPNCPRLCLPDPSRWFLFVLCWSSSRLQASGLTFFEDEPKSCSILARALHCQHGDIVLLLPASAGKVLQLAQQVVDERRQIG